MLRGSYPSGMKLTVPRCYPALTVEEVAHIIEHSEMFQLTSEWIRTYLARPHSELGRSGNVCPFATPALAKDTLRLAVVRLSLGKDKHTQIRDAVAYHRNAFLSHEDAEANKLLQSLLMLFPDVLPDEAADLIDRTKEEMKASFVEQGLMLGEFHSRNDSPGLHNASFLPLRSPIPMLVIRRLVASDFVFLSRQEYDPATRLRYLEGYLLAPGLAESGIRREVERTVAALRDELGLTPRRCPYSSARSIGHKAGLEES